MAEKNIGASVRSKLKNIAQAENKVFNLILTRYALERFLYRLSVSKHRDHFLLKGALLFDLWFDVPLRATRDIDLLGFQLPDAAYLLKTFEDLCDIQVEDGVRFDRAWNIARNHTSSSRDCISCSIGPLAWPQYR